MAESDTPRSLPRDLRTDWHRFVDELVPLRPALYAYCRKLTGTVWDAEDLAQDTLARAFAQWGVTHPRIRNPRAYLLRTATNVWINWQRRVERRVVSPDVDPDDAASGTPGPGEASDVREAGARLLQRLSPQERAALVLKEAFDMALDEIADVLTTTTGAVKAALHRGRGRLKEAEGGAASRRAPASPELLDRFIERWNEKDLDGLVGLMLETSSYENVGNSFHVGTESARGVRGPLHAVVFGHPEWPKGYGGTSPGRMERVEFDGEPVVARFVSGEAGEALTTVMRFEERDGRIASIRSYGFCPDTIRIIADHLGVPAWTGIYRSPTPAPGEAWPGTPGDED